MATVTVFIYRARQGAPRGNCPVCRAWDGEESRVREDLPPAPNPACLEGQFRCHCTIETRQQEVPDEGTGGQGDGGTGGGGGGGGGRNPFDDLERRRDGEGEVSIIFDDGDGEGDVSIGWDPYDKDWWEDDKERGG